MPALSEVRTVMAKDASFRMDRDDPSLGEIRLLTDEGWRSFQLARGELGRLARELRDGLRLTDEDQPEG